MGQTKHIMQKLLQPVILGLGVGLMMAVVARLFVSGIRYFSDMRQSALELPVFLAGDIRNVTPLFVLMATALLIVWLRRVLDIQRFHGPADSIHAAHRTDNELDVKQGLGSTLVAFLAASGGASVGQYGPLVHFGATMGSYFKTMTRSVVTTDIFIGCGVAGAISAAFNAPLAGIVFALEAVLRPFSLRAVAPIAISSITAAAVGQGFFGLGQVFSISPPAIDMLALLPPVLVSGIAFGLVATMLIFLLRRFSDFSANSGLSVLTLTLAAAFICGCVGIFIPEILGLGTQSVSDMLNGAISAEKMALLLVAKLLMTAMCLGLGLYGGIVSPCLFIGASAGGALAIVFAGYGGGALPQVLMVAGIAAITGPVIGAPIAVVLIILEFTQSYNMAVLAMIAVVMAALVCHIFYGASLFDRQLLDRGIDIHKGRGHLELMETPIAGIVHDDYVALPENADAQSAMRKMREVGQTEAYIVTNGQYIGKLGLIDLLDATPDTAAKTALQSDALSIKGDASLMQAIEAASDFVGESIPVVDRETNQLLGVVSESDLFTAYLNLQDKVLDIEGK
jgi:CIC family chloride channel protein